MLEPAYAHTRAAIWTGSFYRADYVRPDPETKDFHYEVVGPSGALVGRYDVPWDATGAAQTLERTHQAQIKQGNLFGGPA